MNRTQVAALIAVLVVIVAVVVAKGMNGQSPEASFTPEERPTGAELAAPPLPERADNAAPGAEAAAQPVPTEGESLPTLLELGSVGCKPCEYMEPIIAALAEELKGKVTVEFHDVAKEPDMAEKHRIMTIPTQVFLDAEGRELFRHVGVFEKEEILAKMKELGMLKE